METRKTFLQRSYKRLIVFIKMLALQIVFAGDIKKYVVKNLNDKIDIPILDEKTEEEVFNIVWDTLEDSIKEELEILEDKA